MEQSRQVPLVIGVAGGLDKVEAIAGALRVDLVDVIICDQAAALAVLHRVADREQWNHGDNRVVDSASSSESRHGTPASAAGT